MQQVASFGLSHLFIAVPSCFAIMMRPLMAMSTEIVSKFASRLRSRQRTTPLPTAPHTPGGPFRESTHLSKKKIFFCYFINVSREFSTQEKARSEKASQCWALQYKLAAGSLRTHLAREFRLIFS
jgi:hypothetical protein